MEDNSLPESYKAEGRPFYGYGEQYSYEDQQIPLVSRKEPKSGQLGCHGPTDGGGFFQAYCHWGPDCHLHPRGKPPHPQRAV